MINESSQLLCETPLTPKKKQPLRQTVLNHQGNNNASNKPSEKTVSKLSVDLRKELFQKNAREESSAIEEESARIEPVTALFIQDQFSPM